MHKEQVQILFERSKNFLEIAKSRLEKKDWDLACFNAEQAAQLYLKATILEISGEIPRIHYIRQLISILAQVSETKINLERKTLMALESAYFLSRYHTVRYLEEDAVEIIAIAEEVIRIVGDIRDRQAKKSNSQKL